MEHERGGPDFATLADAVTPADDVTSDAVTSDAVTSDAVTSDAVTPADAVTSGPDGGDAMAELDIDESLLDTIENELADVERALELLDEGTYGQCESCGRVIDDAVLARAPASRFCPDHLTDRLP